jgi:hypothetical protein
MFMYKKASTRGQPEAMFSIPIAVLLPGVHGYSTSDEGKPF